MAKSTHSILCPFLLQNTPAKKCLAREKMNPTFRTVPTRSKKRKSTVTFYMHPDNTCPNEGNEIKGCQTFGEYIKRLDKIAWIMNAREKREYLWIKNLQVSLQENLKR